jgi:very-short-patch-repair endonuclease
MQNQNLNSENMKVKIPLLRCGDEGDGVDCTPKWAKDSLFPYHTLPKNKQLEPVAKKLKKAGVLSEVLFWNAFKSKKLLGWDIDRQVIIGNYIVDFLIPELGLVVEIDGCSHDDKDEYDVECEKYLASLGLEILHYTDLEVKKSIDCVSESFQLAIKRRVFKLTSTPSANAATPQEGN